jgi:hypothetical protein
MNTGKAVAFLKARTSRPEILGRYHVRVESSSNEVGKSVVASFMPHDKSMIYAAIVLDESIEALQMTGFDHRVFLRYPGVDTRYQDLRHTFLAAANCACDLAEAVDKHLRTDS